MKLIKSRLLALLAAGALSAAAVASPALGAGFFTNGVPPAGGTQYPTTLPLTGAETIPADTNLGSGLNPASEAISTSALAGYIGSAYAPVNYLIGGDFGQNLWQRGTTSAAITTSALYGPDRWWGFSGTGTEVKIIKETGATDITSGFAASARLQRTASQTGVVQSCMGQVLTSANSTSLQGKKVEFATWIKAGANFSASPSQVTLTIATGTGSNESAANFAAGSWTGYAAAVAQATTIGTSWSHVSAVATIPTTATQVGVKICYTPVGTAGANDWFEIGNAQLDVNAGAVAATGVSGTASSIGAFPARPAQQEAALEYAYYWELDESAAVTPYATCGNSTTSLALCRLPFPQPMRAIPTMSYTTGFAANATTALTTLTACSSLATSSAVTSTAVNTLGVLVACGSSAGFGAAGTTSFLYSDGGSGVIKASAEL